jgi:hypothetical protein
MALVDVPLFASWNREVFPANTNLTFNSTNTRFAWAVQAPKTGNIRKLHWRTATVTTAQTIKWSMQDPDAATGFPDGTADQSFTQASPASNTWYTGTFSADRAVTQGDWLSLVEEWDSTAGNITIPAVAAPEFSSHYMASYVSGAWGKGLASTNRGFIGYLEYDDGSIVPILGGTAGIAVNTDFNNAGTYREQGLYFQSPVGLRVCGIGWDGRLTGDADVVLYGSDGTTVLASKSLDKDTGFSTTATGSFAIFSSKVTLSASTWYRAVIKPTSATNVRLNWIDTDANSAFDAVPFAFGRNGYLTRKDSGGTWTQVDSSKPWVWPLCDGIEVGGGGGGIITHAGMNGGLNG